MVKPLGSYGSTRSDLSRLRAEGPQILPSMLLCDFGNLASEVRRLEEAGARALHLDVMDGHFVPNLTYGLLLVETFRRLTDLPLDVHLMISNPADMAEKYVDAGADSVTIHVEAINDPLPVLRRIRERGIAAGLAVNPGTPLADAEPCLAACDLLLVMSVVPGFGGQTFQAVALEKLRELRARCGDDVALAVDGGVNQETIGACAQAGADFFVVGSAIFRSGDYARSIRSLTQSARV